MAGKPLYLVRRELYRFVGPMTLSELRTAYRKMEIGPQDEVCGHCGPWVQLDAIDRLKERYPEVAGLVGDENSAGWAVSGHGEVSLAKSAKRPDRRSEKSDDSARGTGSSMSDNVRRAGYALMFLSVACVAAGAAWFIVRQSNGGASQDDPNAPKTADLGAMLQKNDIFGFMGALEARLPAVIPRVLRSRGVQAEWMPYLRAYAFMQQGQVAGMPTRLLRGDAPAAAPQDCSLAGWTSRWTQSVEQWSSVAAGSRFVRAPWTQVLGWDAHYVARRRGDGWIAQKNYYEACLVMASKALDQVASDMERTPSVKPAVAVTLKIMRKRLQWQLDVAQGRFAPASAVTTPRDAFEAMTCMESASSVAALNRCREFRAATEGWNGLLQHRWATSFARLAIPKIARGEGGTVLVADLAAQLPRLTKSDGLTGLEYAPEAALAREALKKRGSWNESVYKAREAAGEVDLKDLITP